jgi:putative transposase
MIPFMPWSLERYQHTGRFHFITFSCYHRRQYLVPEARTLFEQVLEETRSRFDLVVAGYVVMPNHVHLLTDEPARGTLADAVHWLKWKTSISVEKPESRFWQTRYYDFNLSTEKKHIEKLRYIHWNPVRRGLVEKAEDWPWSSYRWFAFDESRGIKLCEWKPAIMKKDRVAVEPTQSPRSVRRSGERLRGAPAKRDTASSDSR